MKITINQKSEKYEVDLSRPFDISIPLRTGRDNVNAWYADPVKIEPVRMGNWIGDVKQGGSVNFRNVFLNPHANGTHTECVGHISKENYSLNQCMKQFFFLCKLITIQPEKIDGDLIITRKQIEQLLNKNIPEAIVIRTLPNLNEKINRQYSNTDPAYIHHEAMELIVSLDVKHLLIDLPSVDKEKDSGKLLSHRAFWKYPNSVREDCTITELIYVGNEIADGDYFLNIQITSLENDASPSKPLLFELK